MAQPAGLRLFVAVELPDRWRARLTTFAAELEAAAPGLCRWVQPESYHITLAFLGQQPVQAVSTVAAALEETGSAIPRFTLHAGPLGSFSSGRSISIVWAGVSDDPPGSLAGLHRSVTAALKTSGISFDLTPFRAHVTLGRSRRAASPPATQGMQAAITGTPAWAQDSASCTEIVLFQSDLRPTGAVYTSLHRAQLEVD